MKKDIFKVAGKVLKSRLIVGTGKYKSFSETAKAVKASGAAMVTVAVRRGMIKLNVSIRRDAKNLSI